jgi:hypothetical protein
MTLVFDCSKDKNKKALASLTVPSEAVRGLRYLNGAWYLYVSDPEPMAVSRFKLVEPTLEEGARHVQDNPVDANLKKLIPHDGTALNAWLLEQAVVFVEPSDTTGLPSMFPSFPAAGPRPNLGLNPSI